MRYGAVGRDAVFSSRAVRIGFIWDFVAGCVRVMENGVDGF